MQVVVSGASGLIGTALRKALAADGHTVIQLVRTATSQDNQSTWDPSNGVIDASVVNDADAVINLAGVNIGDKKWSDAQRQAILSSRVDSTSLLADTIAAATNKPKVFINGSAIGIYGNRGDETLDETSPRGDGFLADVVHAWEAATQPAQDAGIRTVLARTGIVLDKSHGALAKQLPLFRFGLGGRFGNGKQWQSWISLVDEVRALMFLMTANVSGPVNLTAPNPVTSAEFAKTLGRVLKRPTLLPIPGFGPKILYGSDLVEELLLASTRVTPRVLIDAGFNFSHPTLTEALTAELN
jgi:uncharacterized protein (TIGR01777 family)